MMTVFSYLRFLARCVWVQILSWSGGLQRAEKELRDSGAIVTLTLHRVLDEAVYRSTNSLPGIIIKKRTFIDMVKYLMERYEPVALAEAAPGSISQYLRMAVTFDDGWHDNYATAFPIMRDCKLPITIFVCPALVGRQEPFWPEEAIALLRTARPDARPSEFLRVIERLKRCSPERREQVLNDLRKENGPRAGAAVAPDVDRTLSWDEIREMQRAGAWFGSHTNTHQILTTLATDGVRQELARSKDALEQALGVECIHFAYPNGNWSAETEHVVAEAGFSKAVTTEPGAWIDTSDPLAIPRMNVSESNLVGPTGRFWPAMFQYAIVWKAWRATSRRPVAQKVAPRACSAPCSGD